MSVINQVLKELDRQGTHAVTPNGVMAVNHDSGRLPPPLRVLMGLVAIAGLVSVLVWWRPASPPSAPSAPAASPPRAIELAPRLRMSDQLSPPGHFASSQANPIVPEPPASLPATDAARPAASLAMVKPKLDTRLPELPMTPPGKTGPIQVEAALPAPLQSAAAPTPVVKEIKPPSLQVQAEEAWRQARRWLEQGRQQDAQAHLENALRLDPAHGPARQRLVGLWLEKGASGDAAKQVDSLLREGAELHPDDPWYPRSLAQLQLQRGEDTAAAETLKISLNKRPDAVNWGLYAGLMSKLGKPSEAAQAYREALRLNPTQGHWWIGFAVALEHTGAMDEAVAAYQRALQTRLSSELREYALQKAGTSGTR